MREQSNFHRLGSAPIPSWLNDDTSADAASVGDLPFESAEYERRVAGARARLEHQGLDAILVFRRSSIDYVCGHHTIDPVPQPVLITAEETRIYVPDPEVGRALASADIGTIAHYNPEGEDALALIAADVTATVGEGGRVAVEDRDTSVPPRVIGLLESYGSRVEPDEYLIERMRLVLSSAEVACMERAAVVTEEGAAAAIMAAAEPDATDSSVAAAIAQALHRNADSSAAMDVIVATGRRAGVTHSSFSATPLARGATFTEFSGTHRRYHAPLMVTVSRGPLDKNELRLEGLARTMLAAVVSEARPGRSASEVADAVLMQLGELSPRDIFHFNCGYTIGLAHPPGWMDGAPFGIVRDNHEQLQTGMAFHVPASFRTFGLGGVGLSHTILLEDGGARILTGSDPRVSVVA